ncbi:hypothetical protein C8R46DRAFT_1029184 [Mycena filopes]|nr:hypothetical protein C8R46DRAFT_1029184 [Mycena filopes]
MPRMYYQYAGPQGSAGPSQPSSSRPERTAAGPQGSTASSKPLDTRTYSSPRLSCDHGFDETPSLIEGALFELPKVQWYCGREVTHKGKRYEFWSPNSSQTPFFPGLYFTDLDYWPDKPDQRRFDGFPGPADPTEWAQYDDKDRYWRPFLRRPSSVRGDEACAPAYQPVCVEWTKGREDGDHVKPTFVQRLVNWSNELGRLTREVLVACSLEVVDVVLPPSVPQSAFDSLFQTRCYEEAVDMTARIQFFLREQLAYIDMKKGYPVANEKWVGVWVNNAAEERLARLLDARVPVFFAHRYEPTEMWRSEREEVQVLGSLVEGSEVALRKSIASNGFAFIANREAFPISWWEEDTGRDADLTDRSLDHRLSSSLFIESRQRARASGAELPTALERRIGERREGKFPFKPLDIVALFEGRLENGKEVLLQQAKKWETDQEEAKVVYDRELGREIYLPEDYVFPRGCFKAQTFGWPAPRLECYSRAGSGFVQRSASYWVYPTRAPRPGELGRLAIPPLESELEAVTPARAGSAEKVKSIAVPVVVEDATMEEAPLGGNTIEEDVPGIEEGGRNETGNEELQLPRDKGKGKAEVDDDAVSLGDPASDVEEMEMEEEEPPTAILQ